MKLVEIKNPNTVTPVQMKDGQIGVIRSWTRSVYDDYRDRIVQRHGNLLITLGMGSGCSWTNINDLKMSELQIEILPAGTILEI